MVNNRTPSQNNINELNKHLQVQWRNRWSSDCLWIFTPPRVIRWYQNFWGMGCPTFSDKIILEQMLVIS